MNNEDQGESEDQEDEDDIDDDDLCRPMTEMNQQ
jgi:hypothetical protein